MLQSTILKTIITAWHDYIPAAKLPPSNPDLPPSTLSPHDTALYITQLFTKLNYHVLDSTSSNPSYNLRGTVLITPDILYTVVYHSPTLIHYSSAMFTSPTSLHETLYIYEVSHS